MKKIKKLLVLLAAGVFVAICVFNVILGSANYDKVSSSLFTLEALSNGEEEGGGGEAGSSGQCKTVKKPEYRTIDWNCSCAAGVFQPYPREYIYYCAGTDGGACNPGSVLVYYNCDGSIDSSLSSDDRSIAYCSND
jgi:hypothetical protein